MRHVKIILLSFFVCASALADSEICTDPFAGLEHSVKTADLPSLSYDPALAYSDVQSEIRSLFQNDRRLQTKAIQALSLQEKCGRQDPCEEAVKMTSMLLTGGRLSRQLPCCETNTEKDIRLFSKNLQSFDFKKFEAVKSVLDDKVGVFNLSYDQFLLRYSKQNEFFSKLLKDGQQAMPPLAEIAKKSVLKFLKNQPIDESSRAAIIKRINKIKFSICDGVTSENASYNKDENTVCVGLGLIRLSTVVSVIAHEIGHSFDPCSWQMKNKEQDYPFTQIAECLRTKESIGAVARSPALKGLCKIDGLFIEDQIGESFADWVSSEVLLDSQSMFQTKPTDPKGYVVSNLAWMAHDSIVEQPKIGSFNEHPPLSERVNKIFFANPAIRNLFGCRANNAPRFCSFGSAPVAPRKGSSSAR